MLFLTQGAFAGNKSKTYVLLVGIASYQSQKLPALIAPINDIRSIKQSFRKYFNIPQQQVFVEENISKSDFKNRLENIRLLFKDNDQLIIYYSGHGIVDLLESKKEGYWAFSDTSADNVETWMSNTELVDTLSDFPSGGVLLLVDSDFSGRLIINAVENKNAFSGLQKQMSFSHSENARLALTSVGEYSAPDSGINSLQSDFAQALIKAIEKSVVMAQQEGMSTIPSSLIYFYTNLELTQRFQPTPQFGSFTNNLVGGRVPDILLNIR
jgi:hypothetical protein